MNRTLSMILGAVAVGALCLFCASRHSRLIVNKLTGSSQAVLSEANYSWANVAFDGRDATLNGVAPTPEDRDTALALVGQIRGVRSVSSLLTVGDQVNELRARRGAGLVSLSGSVPTEATRAGILQR
ncbi:MAG: BON domain-containing protein, partial [Bacteroidetes bacterium]|nr:BON domain-containing protein [Bacteroidota bacterium]